MTKEIVVIFMVGILINYMLGVAYALWKHSKHKKEMNKAHIEILRGYEEVVKNNKGGAGILGE